MARGHRVATVMTPEKASSLPDTIGAGSNRCLLAGGMPAL